jgi:MSHA biogenesis protein MshP
VNAQRQRGMSLVAAMFVIVTLAMLALFAVRVSASGEQDVTMALMQGRALAAARSGIEYGAYRAELGAGCPLPGTVYTWSVPLTQGALTGFTATVTCVSSTHTNAGVPYRTYEIMSTARRGTYGTSDYVARAITKTVAISAP